MRYVLALCLAVAVLSYFALVRPGPDAVPKSGQSAAADEARPAANDNVQGLQPRNRSYRIYD